MGDLFVALRGIKFLIDCSKNAELITIASTGIDKNTSINQKFYNSPIYGIKY